MAHASGVRADAGELATYVKAFGSDNVFLNVLVVGAAQHAPFRERLCSPRKSGGISVGSPMYPAMVCAAPGVPSVCLERFARDGSPTKVIFDMTLAGAKVAVDGTVDIAVIAVFVGSTELRPRVSRVRVWREALGDSCALDFAAH